MEEQAYIVGGVRYASIDDVPEPVRSQIRTAIATGSSTLAGAEYRVHPAGERYRYEVDGVTYESMAEVPQPHRALLERALADHDGDGMPDLFQGAEGTSAAIEVDGVRYESIDDVPESHRSQIAGFLGGIGADQHGEVASVSARAEDASRPTSRGHGPIVQPAGWSGRTKLLVAFVLLDVVAVGVILWLFTR